jgi:hypothetical protein
MSNFSKLEFDVMDEVYFISSFQQIADNTNATTEELMAVLKSLLQKEFIHQLIYNSTLHDFEKMDKYDEAQLETASYVASRKGLLAHNSSN